MTDLTLHDDIDRLDTGIAQDPDVSGIISAARRRRRRTRAIMTVGGLATAAVVAPLAMLVGGTTAVPSGTSGVAAAPAAATAEADPAAIEAAVLELFPGAEADAAVAGTFTLANGATLEVKSGRASTFVCDCPVEQVGDQKVWVGGGGAAVGPTWFTDATTLPVAAADGSAVQVRVEASFVAETQAEGRAALPADDLLAQLAADERLKPETGWTDLEAPETSALTAIGDAVEERIPGLRTISATDSDGIADETFVGAGGPGSRDGERVISRVRGYDATSAGFDRLGVFSGTDSYRQECGDQNSHRYSCTQVGDLTVQVTGGFAAHDHQAFWNVSVYPTDPSRTQTVEISAVVEADSFEEAEAKLPSLETLKEIALDARLTPPAL
jgi:hypothetical protein